MKNYNRIAIISNYPKLDTLYNHWKKLHRVTHDSWPALFSTKEHKRRVVRRDKMALRFIAAVRKEFNVIEYDVKDIGRRSNSQVVVVWDEK